MTNRRSGEINNILTRPSIFLPYCNVNDVSFAYKYNQYTTTRINMGKNKEINANYSPYSFN